MAGEASDPTSCFVPWAAPEAPPRPTPAPPWLDPGLFRFLGAGLLRPIADHLLRVEVQGFATMPARGPAIVVVNHSGATWLRDGALFLQRWAEHVGYDAARLPRAFGLPRFWDPGHLAGAPASMKPSTSAQVEAALRDGGIVLWYPEDGADIIASSTHRGPGPFLPDFVAAALRHGAAIVPVACHGSERFPWSSRDPFRPGEGPRFVVGEPLALALDPASATAADHQRAADALRAIVLRMLHESHRPGPPRWQRELRPVAPWPGLEALRGRGTRSPASPPFGAPMPPPAPPARPVVSAPAPDAGLARRVAVLEAQNEVARAMFTWGRALDRVERTKARADAEEIALRLMTSDGVMDFAAVGWGVWGPDKERLVADILAFSKRIGWSYHTYPNGGIEVDLEGRTAHFTTSTEVVPLTRDGVFQWYFLTQRTDFRAEEGGWKVARYTLSDLRIAPGTIDRW